MIIDLRADLRLASGYYADIFGAGERAYKLFNRFPIVPPKQTDEGRRTLFRSQCEAFARAATDPWLKNHVASFYGPNTVEDVLDENGTSITNRYLLECCYGLELLDGTSSKFALLRDTHPHLRQAAKHFSVIGVAVLDADVFNADDPDAFKFVDLELRNFGRLSL